jgi:cytochrome c
MRAIIVAGVALAGLVLIGPASASSELAKKSGCLNCHAVDTKKVGPAFKDVAASQKGKAGADAALVGKLMGGKYHPKVKASEDEVKTLVKWVLAL